MKIPHIYLFLCVNLVAIVMAHYRSCYASYSLCLITDTTYDTYYNNLDSKFRLNRWSAEKWCKDQSSSLAIITNDTVQSAIEEFVDDHSAKLVNSVVLTNGLRFNLSNWEWVTGRESAIYPNSTHDTYRYVFLTVSSRTSYYLSDGNPTWKMKFICSKTMHSTDSSCSSGFRQLGRSCYKIHDRTATWFGARSMCHQEESDLATFEDGISSLPSELIERYWIGLRKERWYWLNDQRNYEELKYSNWEEWYPGSTGGDCLCLKRKTGKWRNCDCSLTYRYVCIQDYASGSTSTVMLKTRMATTTPKVTTTTPEMTNTTTTSSTKTSTMTATTTRMAKVTTTQKSTTKTTKTTTTKIPITAKQITTTPTKLQTTRSTTTSTSKFRASTSQFHSTPTQTLDDDFGSKLSENSAVTVEFEQTSGFLPIIGIGIACLLILIVVIAAVVFIKNRRSRSGDHEPTNGNFPPPMTYKDDAPNTVYAAVIPNSNEPVCSASEKNSNQTVYAELDLEPKRNIGSTQRASNPSRFTSEGTPSQAVYAEVSRVPTENMNGGPEGPSVYDNYSQMMTDSVYANSAQTKV